MQQTFSDFELLLIDNSQGSHSVLAERVSSTDSRIIYVYKDGIGKCAARNFGIDMAKGKFICFVDSDDYVKPNYLEALLSVFDRFPNASIAIGEGERVDENGVPLSSFSNANGEYTLISSNPYYAFCNAGRIGPWEHLILKDTIGKLRFNETIRTMEDRLFFMELYLNVREMVIISLPLYCYRTSPDSDTVFQGADWLNATHLERLFVSNRIFEIVRNKNAEKMVRDKALKSAIASCLSYYCGMYSFRHPIDGKAEFYRKQVLSYSKLEQPFCGVAARATLRFPRLFYVFLGRWLFSPKARQRRAKKRG